MIPRDLPGQIADLYSRIGEMERRARNRKRTGIVEEGPDDQGRYRVKLSEPGGTPFITGWIKAKTLGAGNVKIDVVHVKGEQVDVVSESGDLADAVIDLATYSDANARENSSTPLHIKIGGTVLEVTGEAVTLTAGTINFKGDLNVEGAVAITGASLTHNGVNISATHVHGGVAVGGADTAEPH